MQFMHVFTSLSLQISSIPKIGKDGSLNYSFTIFAISYFVVVNWTLLQVTVAILLNSFVGAISTAEEEETRAAMHGMKSKELLRNTLDPLLGKLTLDYVDDHDLSLRLAALFKLLDSDEDGSLSFIELCQELKKLDFTPCIHLTEVDFGSFTQEGALCGPDGLLNPAAFEKAMRQQLRQYAGRRLSDFLAHAAASEAEVAQAQTLKVLMTESLTADRRLAQLELAVEGNREDVLGIRGDVTEILRLLTALPPSPPPPVAPAAPPAVAAAHDVVARFGAHLAARRGAAAAASSGLPGVLPSESGRLPVADAAPPAHPQAARTKQRILSPSRPPAPTSAGRAAPAPADWNLAGELIRVLVPCIPRPAAAATPAAADDAVLSTSPPSGSPQGGNVLEGRDGFSRGDGEAAQPTGESRGTPLPRLLQKFAGNLLSPTSSIHPAVTAAAADRAVASSGGCLSSAAAAPAPDAAAAPAMAVETSVSPSPAGPQALPPPPPSPPAVSQSPSPSPSPGSPSPTLETHLLGLVGCWERHAAHSRLKVDPAGAARAGGAPAARAEQC